MVDLLAIFGGLGTWELEEEANLELKLRDVPDPETPQSLIKRGHARGGSELWWMLQERNWSSEFSWHPDTGKPHVPSTHHREEPWALETTAIQNP